MKKNWLYLFALICSMSLFTACSDDEPATLPVENINATYTSTDASNQLQLTYGDVAMTGKSVTFNSADGQTATITMSGAANELLGALLDTPVNNPGVVPGEATTTLNVTLVPQGETSYTFEGTDEANGRTLNYSGSVEAGKLTLDVDATFTNDLIGTWNLWVTPSADDTSNDAYPIHAVWESDTQLSLLGGLITMPFGDVLNIALRMPIINDGTVSVNQVLNAVLQSVTFGADGNIIATYSDAANMASPSWQASPAGMVQYVVKDGRLYAYLDIDAIMGSLTAAQTKAGVDDLLAPVLAVVMQHIGEIAPLLTDGIPLDYSIDEETGALSVYIAKNGLGDILVNIATELLNNPDFVATLSELMASDPSFGSMAGMLDLTQLPAIFSGTTNIELGLNFNPAE